MTYTTFEGCNEKCLMLEMAAPDTPSGMRIREWTPGMCIMKMDGKFLAAIEAKKSEKWYCLTFEVPAESTVESMGSLMREKIGEMNAHLSEIP